MEQTDFKYDVFISYNHGDEEWVTGTLLPALEGAGPKVCIDFRDFEAGKPALLNMQDAAKGSRHVLLTLTHNWLKGEWTFFEALIAGTKDPSGFQRKIIPLLCEAGIEKEIPEFISMRTWVDFTRKDREVYAWKQLFTALGKPNASLPTGVKTGQSEPKISEGWYLAHPYPMPPNFTGRTQERKLLSDWLENDREHALLILRALGGFGKSALTWHWLTHDVQAAQWPKVVFWSFYEGDASFENFLKETLKYLGVPAEMMNPRQQADFLLALLQKPGIILILDGFERVLRAYGNMSAAYQGDELRTDKDETQDASRDCTNLFADTFLRSVGAYAGLLRSKVLMTTRLTPRAVEYHGQFLQGVREMEVRAMNKADAVDFFHAQGIRGTRTEIEAACEPYGYHPLSLRILSGYIVNDRRQPGDIRAAQGSEITNDIIQNKHHILEVGFNSLFPAQKKLLGRIACFRSAMDYEALKTLHGDGKGSLSFDTSLKVLESRGFLYWDRKTNKYDLHPIVRRYAYDRLTAADRAGAHGRLVNYFEAVPKPEKVEKLEDLAPVIELYHHMVGAGNLDEAVRLFRDRFHDNLYYQFGSYQLLIELIHALFLDGEDKPPRLKDEPWQAWALGVLANSYSVSGQPRRAVLLFEMDIAILEKLGHKKVLPTPLGNVAHMAQLPIGAFNAAERNLHRQISLCSEIADEIREAIGHQELGRVLSYRSAWQEAEHELDKSLKLAEEERHGQMQGVTWSYCALRFLLLARGNPKSEIENLKSSIECAQHALEQANEDTKQRYTHPRDYVRAYWLLGAAYRANWVSTGSTSELTLAEDNLSKALDLCRQINLVETEADILLDVARLSFAYALRAERSRSPEAEEHFKDAQEKASEALVITERCEYVLQGADVNNFLAELTFTLDPSPEGRGKAKQYAETALKLATCDGPPYYYKVAYEEAERMLEKLK